MRVLASLLIPSVAALLLIGAVSARPAGAQTPGYNTMVTCDDGTTIGTANATGACAEDGGVQSYQNVAFVCNDGFLVPTGGAQNGCAAHQGVAEQPSNQTAPPPPTPVAPPAPRPAFPLTH